MKNIILSLALIIGGIAHAQTPTPPRISHVVSQSSPVETSTSGGTNYACCAKQNGCSNNSPSNQICQIQITSNGTCPSGWNLASDFKGCLAKIDSDYNWSVALTWNQTNGDTWSFNTPKNVTCSTPNNCSLCCNKQSGIIVPASATGCDNASGLIWVSTADECVKAKNFAPTARMRK